MENTTLMDPDLSKKGDPKLGIPDTNVPLKMTRGRMLGIARHVGNESNFDKLVRGWKWKPEDVMSFLQRNMTRADWEATQAHWDSFDPSWEETKAMYKRLSGVLPPKVPAREFDVKLPDGSTVHMKGGYSPIDYDPLRSRISVRKGEFDLGPNDRAGDSKPYSATTTMNSSLIARSQGYADRVNLDFHSSEARMRDTLHDLAYREALLSVSRILDDNKFRQKFITTYGREEYAGLKSWLAAIRDIELTDMQGERAFQKAMSYTKQGVVLTGIGYRLSTVFKHGGSAELKTLGYLSGPGAKYFAARIVRMASGHQSEDLAAAMEKFSEIRFRKSQQDRDLKSGTRSMYEAEDWRAKNERFGHSLVAWSDLLSATPTAWAAYDLAKTEGVPKSMGGTGEPMTEEQAVEYANSVVRQAHGTALEAARSNFMLAKGTKNLFGALYGFMNNTYGQMSDMLDKSISGGYFKNNPQIAARLFATLIVPAMWAQWLSDSGPGENDSAAAWMGRAITGEVAATVPFVRDAWALIEHGHSGQVGAFQIVEDTINSLKDVAGEVEGKSTRLIQDLFNAVGELAHVAGLGELGHILQHARDVQDGKKEPSVWRAVVGGEEPPKGGASNP